MALVQYTAVVNQLRGKLNGSVFNRAKTSFTLQRKQQPPKGARGNQLARRSRYSAIQRMWKGLSMAQHQSWATTAELNPAQNRFGEQVVLAGYNQFIKAGILAVSAGMLPPETGFAAPAPSVSFNLLNVGNFAISVNENGDTLVNMTVQTNVSGNTGQERIIFDLSLPQSTGRTTLGTGWRLIGSMPAVTVGSNPVFGNLGSKYPSVVPGQRMFVRARIVHIPSGAVVYTQLVQIDIPQPSAIDTWSAERILPGNNVQLSISYDPASTGVPPFHAIEVRSARLDSPTATWADLTQPQPGIETVLQNANTAVTAVGQVPGTYYVYGVRLYWASTGQLVSEEFASIQDT